MEGYFTQSSSATGPYLPCPLLWRVYIKLSSNFGPVAEHQYLYIFLRSPTLERTSIRKQRQRLPASRKRIYLIILTIASISAKLYETFIIFG